MATDSTHLSASSLTISTRFSYLELWPVCLIFGLILLAVWMPPGPFLAVSALLMIGGVLIFSLRSGYTAGELGLTKPFRNAGVIVAAGIVLAGLIAVCGHLWPQVAGAAIPVPLHRAWQYAIWAMIQEFILQSFFFLRFEAVFGGKKSVWIASGLFAVAHIPNPLLTPLSFLGALFFCEMFRRYRNLYPIGAIHALLGLTIAASLPDSLLHHMRVGIGYLMYHH